MREAEAASRCMQEKSAPRVQRILFSPAWGCWQSRTLQGQVQRQTVEADVLGNVWLRKLAFTGVVAGALWRRVRERAREGRLGSRQTAEPQIHSPCQGVPARALPVGAPGNALDPGKQLPINRISVSLARLIFLYVCCDMSVYIVGERATHNYTKETVICASAVLSIVLGTTLSFLRRGRKGLAECYDLATIAKLFPVAASFCISQFGLLKTFQYFDGAFIKLLGQMKLPLTALLSYFVLGRRYSGRQWLIMSVICVSCCIFTLLRVGGVQAFEVPGHLLDGLIFVFIWIMANILASLFSERVYQARPDWFFPTLMVNTMIGELCASSLMLAVEPEFQVLHFFKGWDRTTLAVLSCLMMEEWLSALMVRRLSSVSKILSKACSMVFLYMLALASGAQQLCFWQVVFAFCIMVSTASFPFM